MKYCPYCGQNMGRKKQCPSCGRDRIKPRSRFGLIKLLLVLAVGFMLGLIAGGYRPDFSSPSAALASLTGYLQHHQNTAPQPTDLPLMSDSSSVPTPAVTVVPTAASAAAQSGSLMEAVVSPSPARVTGCPTVAAVIQKATATPVPKVTAVPTVRPGSPSGGVVTPSFKKAMDDYETFIDEYVSYLTRYRSNPTDLSLAASYLTMMTRYQTTMRELDAIDEDQLSSADYAYYTQAMLRINGKLLTVAEQ